MQDEEDREQEGTPKGVTSKVIDPYMLKKGITTIKFIPIQGDSPPNERPTFAQLFTTIYRKKIIERVFNLPDFEPPKSRRKSTKKKPG